MNLDEALTVACKEKTFIDALVFIAVWESERAIQQALEYRKTGVSTAGDGKGWDTCFRTSFEALNARWTIQHLNRNLDVTKSLS